MLVECFGDGAGYPDCDDDATVRRCELWSTGVGSLSVASSSKTKEDISRLLSNGGNLKKFLEAAKQVQKRARAKNEAGTASEEGFDGASDESEKLDDMSPASKFEETSSTQDCREITTMMIRNLPANVTQRRLIEEINRGDFGEIDYCYMPSTYSTGKGNGYAFVNYTSAKAAKAFTNAWHMTFRFGMKKTDPALNISPAQLQGKEANMIHWSSGRMRRIRNMRFRPFVEEKKQRSGSTNVELAPLIGTSQVSQSPVPLGSAHPCVLAASCGLEVQQSRTLAACDKVPCREGKMAWDPMGLSG